MNSILIFTLVIILVTGICLLFVSKSKKTFKNKKSAMKSLASFMEGMVTTILIPILVSSLTSNSKNFDLFLFIAGIAIALLLIFINNRL